MKIIFVLLLLTPLLSPAEDLKPEHPEVDIIEMSGQEFIKRLPPPQIGKAPSLKYELAACFISAPEAQRIPCMNQTSANYELWKDDPKGFEKSIRDSFKDQLKKAQSAVAKASEDTKDDKEEVLDALKDKIDDEVEEKMDELKSKFDGKVPLNKTSPVLDHCLIEWTPGKAAQRVFVFHPSPGETKLSKITCEKVEAIERKTGKKPSP